MRVIESILPGMKIIEPAVFGDERGYFMESYSKAAMAELGITAEFVQDNHSYTAKNL